MLIAQALVLRRDADDPQLLARSPGFLDSWRHDAERLCIDFGECPLGVTCPFALFARPFGYRRVAVVQIADQETGGLAFRILVLSRKLYGDLEGDLFWISDELPPQWGARGDLPTLEWTAGPPPRRTVADVRRVLNVVADRTQTLLGGVQVLVDGGRLVFQRQAPDDAIVRELWTLLPAATRAELWPTTFAFGNKHRFHVAVLPDATGPDLEYYVREEHAGDHPEGRYELALQTAAERGDQDDIDELFARRSRGQTLRLALVLLAAFILIPLLLSVPMRPAAPVKKAVEPKKEIGEKP